MEKGNLIVRHKIPYSDIRDLSPEEFEQIVDDGTIFAHTHEDMIQGQIEAGLLIAGYYEDRGSNSMLLDEYIFSFFATKAIKIK